MSRSRTLLLVSLLSLFFGFFVFNQERHKAVIYASGVAAYQSHDWFEAPWSHSVRGSAWFGIREQEHTVDNASRCSARNASHSHDTPQIGFRCTRSLP
jgi:hypothetical protein